MKTWDFFELIKESNLLVATILILLFLFQFRFNKKNNFGYFDPIGYQFIVSLFSISVVLFLYFTNQISFLLTLSIILIGSSFYYGLGKLNFPKNNFNYKSIHTYLIISLIGYILFYSVMLSSFGLPIFLESRVELTSIDSGGSRFIFRILSYFRPICLFCSFLLLNTSIKKFKFLSWFSILLISFESLTSGSKSGLILMVLYPTLIIRLFQPELIKSLKKNYKLILSLSLVSIPIITILLYSNPLILAYRMIMSGDIYYHVLPNYSFWENYYNIGIYAIFPSLSKFLGFTDIYTPGFNLGNDIYDFYYGIKNMGPTRRLPLFLFLNLGLIIGVFISFLAGKFLRFTLKILSRHRVNYVYTFFWLPLFISATDFLSDYPYAQSKIIDSTLIGGVLISTIYILKWHKSLS